MSKFHAGWDSDAKRRCLPCRGMFLFDCVFFLLGMLFLGNESRKLQHIRIVQAVQQGIYLTLIRAFQLFNFYRVARIN